jgi:hypothetical protein
VGTRSTIYFKPSFALLFTNPDNHSHEDGSGMEIGACLSPSRKGYLTRVCCNYHYHLPTCPMYIHEVRFNSVAIDYSVWLIIGIRFDWLLGIKLVPRAERRYRACFDSCITLWRFCLVLLKTGRRNALRWVIQYIGTKPSAIEPPTHKQIRTDNRRNPAARSANFPRTRKHACTHSEAYLHA